MVLRHLAAVALLPFTMTVMIPLWIAERYHVTWAIGSTPIELAVQAAGVVALAIGLLFFGASLRLFAKKGRGTLAPWDPPRHLVVSGPYRYVRNPMISGVVFILFGEALALRSWPHAGWACLFLCLNLMYIPAIEEPELEGRFGEAYREYRRHVPRVFPRARPWRPPGV